MEIIQTKLDCYLLSIPNIPDNRGWFRVAFSVDELHRLNLAFEAVHQMNHSFTEYAGTVRGLNYQEAPYAQAKVIRCVKGALYSVGVNIDRSSENFGKWCGFVLDCKDYNLMYVPRGYAHGFVALEDATELEYFTDNKYSFEHAKSVRYDDPEIGIDWTVGGRVRIQKDILSTKNLMAPSLKDI